MGQMLSSKHIVFALLCSLSLQACASFMSRQQEIEYFENKLQLTVGPTSMPPLFSKKVKRLSIIYVTPAEEYPATTSIVDLTINYLIRQQADLTLVEREAVAAVQKELAYQLTGSVSPETISQVGKHLGADALLLIYFKPISSDDFEVLQVNGGIISASVDLRLIHVEDGNALFRTNTIARAFYPKPPDNKYWQPNTIKSVHDAVTGYAAASEFAALAAAFGENPLGYIPDSDAGIGSQLKKETRPGVTVWGLLEGSPAHKSGLQRFDRIVRVDGRPIFTWMDKIKLPATVTVERDGTEINFRVQ